MTTEHKTIKFIPEDFIDNIYLSVRDCPLARALNREYPNVRIVVGGYIADVGYWTLKFKESIPRLNGKNINTPHKVWDSDAMYLVKEYIDKGKFESFELDVTVIKNKIMDTQKTTHKSMLEILEETAKFYNSNNRGVDDGNHCVYYSDETPEIKMCAVGRCLVNPEKFKDRLNTSIDDLMSKSINFQLEFKPEYRGYNEFFWSELQQFHDGTIFGMKTD